MHLKIVRVGVMSFVVFSVVVISLIGCGQRVEPLTTHDIPATHEQFSAGWQQLVSDVVDEHGMVDFTAVSTRMVELERLVAAIAKLPAPTDQRAALAYHLNAYNVLAMKGVVVHDYPKDLKSLLVRAGFFRNTEYLINGIWINLEDYENTVIRAIPDARLHVGINCMSISCPRLRDEAYLPDTLDQQLDAAMREFARSDQHVAVDHKQQEVALSAILKWYREDFPGQQWKDLIPYLNSYREEPIPEHYSVHFLPYDWTIIYQQ